MPSPVVRRKLPVNRKPKYLLGCAARPACQAQVQALYDCVENEPVANWICHPIGEYPALSTNTCSAENDAVGSCFGE